MFLSLGWGGMLLVGEEMWAKEHVRARIAQSLSQLERLQRNPSLTVVRVAVMLLQAFELKPMQSIRINKKYI